MAYGNVCLAGTPSQWAGGSGDGVLSYVKDGNQTTYYGSHTWGRNSSSAELGVDVTFAAATIQQVVVRKRAQNTGSSDSPRWIQYFQLRISGVWTTIWGSSVQYSTQVNDDHTVGAVITVNGTWKNVTGLRVYIRVSNGGNTVDVTAWVFEMMAMGYTWSNIGLYVKEAAGITTIPVSPLTATDKLRICKSGIVYAIDLLDTTDALASGVRILSGGVVKALPKM